MPKTKYRLTKEFESFEEDTEFTRVASYGESHVYDEKLETENSRGLPTHISVTEEQLEESFSQV